MAYLFDEIDDHIIIADHSALTLPDGDWTISFWMKLTDNDGSVYQFILTTDGAGSTEHYFLILNESTGILWFNAVEGANSVALYSATSIGESTDWQHVILVHEGDDFTFYIDNSVNGTTSNASFGELNSTHNHYIGTRYDFSSTRYFGGQLAELAKWDRALSSDERAGLASGKSIEWYPDYAYKLAMLDNLTDKYPADLSITDNSSGATTGPTLSYPPTGNPHYYYQQQQVSA